VSILGWISIDLAKCFAYQPPENCQSGKHGDIEAISWGWSGGVGMGIGRIVPGKLNGRDRLLGQKEHLK